MLKIVCVDANNYLGRGREYVAILADMVARNIPDGTEYQFICFSDNDEPLDGVEFKPLHGGLQGWWNKLYLFKAGHFEDSDRVIFFDLDTVITGNLDDIINYDGEFAILRDFYRPNGYCSSNMSWCGGFGAYIWDQFELAGYPNLDGGDQTWLEQKVSNADIWQDILPGQFVSYKAHAWGFIPSGARIVAFHGLPKPHECGGWVERFWKIGGDTTLDGVIGNTEEIQLIENIEYSTSLDRRWVQMMPAHDGHAVIVGGAPSLKGDIEEIRKRSDAGQSIFTLNNSWKYLDEMEIADDFHVMLDARPENVEFMPQNANGTVKYYASQCAKQVWGASPEAILWNHLNAQKIIGDDPRANTLIAGGSTVGLNAMALAYVLGYRQIHLYGFDSSYEDDAHHAYSQPINDNQRIIMVSAAGREFKTAAWMAQQVNEFCLLLPQLIELGCTVTVHGNGLLPHVAKHLSENPEAVFTAADERAMAIFDRIDGMKNPVGVEVGVFTGELSKRLLKRDDLSLFMVDSWKEHGQDSDYAKSGDYHGALAQSDQDRFFQHTNNVTAFAGARASIIRKDSVAAASDFADESLDFVFLDADHTYEAIKADISAWMPKVKPGGVLSGHDYENPGYPAWGVKKAVDETGKPVDLGLNFTWFIRK